VTWDGTLSSGPRGLQAHGRLRPDAGRRAALGRRALPVSVAIELRRADGRDDDSFVSQKVEQMRETELDAAITLATKGWSIAWKMLVDANGAAVRGRWIDSRHGHCFAVYGEGDRFVAFISGEVMFGVRNGRASSVKALARKGFRFVDVTERANCGRVYPVNSGFAGLWSSHMVNFPCDERGADATGDRLMYPADEFSTDLA
jgi:hypothetical protein